MKSLFNLKLSDIASDKVLGILPDCSLGEAARRMADAQVSSLVVMDGRFPVGILTERDMLRQLCERVADAIPVVQIMSAPVLTASPELDFRTAYLLLRRHQVRHLVVVNASGEVLGMASATDFRAHLELDVFRKIDDLRAVMDQDMAVLPPESALSTAFQRMLGENSDYVVVAHNRQPLGIVTERDLPRLFADHADPDSVRLGDVMRTPVHCIASDVSVAEAAMLMTRHRVRHIPVVDGKDGLIGVLSQNRLLEKLGIEILDDAWRHQETLREEKAWAESQLQMVLEATGLGIWEYDHRADRHGWSSSLLVLLGYSAEPASSSMSAWLDMIHPGDSPRVSARMKAVLASGNLLFEEEYRFRKGDGSWLWVHNRARVVERDGEGRPLLTVGTIADISARKHAELLLKAQHEFARVLAAEPDRETLWAALFDCALLLPEVDGGGLCWRRDEGGYELVAHRGLSAECVGRMARMAADSAWAALIRQGRRQCGCPRPGEHCTDAAPVRETALVREGVCALAIVPVLVDGEPLACLSVVGARARQLDPATLDALEALACQFAQALCRQRAQKELERERGFLKTLIQTIPDLVWLKDPNGVFLACNPVFERLCGAREADILGKTDYDFFAADLTDFFRKNDRAAIAAGGPKSNEEWLTFSADGYHGLFETVKTPMYDAEGRLLGVLGLARDITQARAAQEALREDREKLRGLYELCPLGIALTDMNGHYVEFNEAFGRICGYPENELKHLDYWTLTPKKYEAEEAAQLDSLARTGHYGPYEKEYRRKDGHLIPLRLNGMLVTGADGQRYIWSIVEDITDRKRMEEALREREREFRTLAENSPDIFTRYDRECRWAYVSPALARAIGKPVEPMLGKTPTEYWPLPTGPEQAAAFEAQVRRVIDTGEPGEWEVCWRMMDETPRHFQLRGVPEFDAEGRIASVLTVARDITAIKESQRRIEFLATHDELTSLPNRGLFLDRVRKAIARSRRRNTVLAVLFIDLDNFKVVNDSLGHPVGDEILKKVAARLHECIRAADTVSRFGGDEFAVLVEEVTAADANTAACRIGQAMARPLSSIGGQNIYLSASIGISLFPDDGEDAETLLKQADSAMYRAKESGKRTHQFFTSDLKRAVDERLRLENGLRRAIDRDELFLLYQPQIDMASGTLIGVEALVRWQHPDYGLIPPMKFIPLAEKIGLIDPIGEWVADAACRQLASWLEQGCEIPSVSINISAEQLRHSGIPKVIRRLLDHYRLAPERITLELTESTLMADPDLALKLLGELKALGAPLSIDDFGTGYSSLAYLRRYPLDELKIDRGFVREIASNPDDRAIARTIIAMSRTLGLSVVAEGIETQEQLEVLRGLGCHVGQGYLFAEPLPPDEVVARFLR